MAIRLTRTRVAILVVALAAAGFGIWKWTQRGPKPVEVQTAVVLRADLQAKVTANGKIQAQRKVDISATIAGQITHLAVREGDRVTKGQFLLQIDPVSPRATARSSEASMQALLREVDSARATLGPGARSTSRARKRTSTARIIPEMEVQQRAHGRGHRGGGAAARPSGGWSRRAPRWRARRTPCRKTDGPLAHGRHRHRQAGSRKARWR